MIVTKARRNPVKGVTTFYVQRTRSSTRHIVQRIVRSWADARGRVRARLFCDCKDFMCRRLPHIGTNTFSFCIHTRAVRDQEQLRAGR